LLPVKLGEYLAAGLPVVSTGLPEVRAFVAEHGPVVSIADGAEAFAAAIRSALATGSADEVSRRVAIARGFDSRGRLTTMSALMEAALARRESRRAARRA